MFWFTSLLQDQYYFCYQALKDYVDSTDVFYKNPEHSETYA